MHRRFEAGCFRFHLISRCTWMWVVNSSLLLCDYVRHQSGLDFRCHFRLFNPCSPTFTVFLSFFTPSSASQDTLCMLSLSIHTSYPYVSHYWKNRQNLLQSRANEPHLVFCGEAVIKTVMSERRKCELHCGLNPKAFRESTKAWFLDVVPSVNMQQHPVAHPSKEVAHWGSFSEPQITSIKKEETEEEITRHKRMSRNRIEETWNWKIINCAKMLQVLPICATSIQI